MRNNRITVALLVCCFSFYLLPPTSAGAGSKWSPCDAISVAQAAEILGTAATDLKVETSDLLPDRCAIRSKTNLLKTLSFSIYREKTPADASASLRKMAENFSFLSKIEPISGLGDEAIYAGDDRLKRLVLRSGPFLIDIRRPRDRLGEEKIARILITGIH